MGVRKGLVVGYSRISTKDKNREGEEKNWEGKWLAKRREDDGNGKERRMDGENDPNSVFIFFLKKILARLMKDIFSFYFCNCTFCVKSQIFFSNGSLNYGYAILSDIITNIYKLVA